ncbi:MAG: tRNA (5-methylaminomethyl-2-thiouridine)(34)-methyltransferase MnmD, partial [Planctomycetes bacterium]|nr:tRNA (5-methylaminomethyl-2-thiouridine)(34)-methyltransferase MnmD [Planctomycetota bacterium]
MTDANLEHAHIKWLDDGFPESTAYGDQYFCGRGLEESQYVFLQQSSLAERFQTQERVVVAETGFGTGLNFLASWKLLAEQNFASELHYYSVEKFPLSSGDLEKALALWPELEDYGKELWQKLPALEPGRHDISLANNKVHLTLLYGDIMEVLPEVELSADIWYLDGFAPKLNPEMWRSEVFEQMAAKSK